MSQVFENVSTLPTTTASTTPTPTPPEDTALSEMVVSIPTPETILEPEVEPESPEHPRSKKSPPLPSLLPHRPHLRRRIPIPIITTVTATAAGVTSTRIIIVISSTRGLTLVRALGLQGTTSMCGPVRFKRRASEPEREKEKDRGTCSRCLYRLQVWAVVWGLRRTRCPALCSFFVFLGMWVWI
ncbi:hypothetical protein BDZ97DRAFT_1023656 [Flammula alnicola]|nr:hypothetical protein BDZ97DRAFT_1023656 [Flammula alnicola]